MLLLQGSTASSAVAAFLGSDDIYDINEGLLHGSQRNYYQYRRLFSQPDNSDAKVFYKALPSHLQASNIMFQTLGVIYSISNSVV